MTVRNLFVVELYGFVFCSLVLLLTRVFNGTSYRVRWSAKDERKLTGFGFVWPAEVFSTVVGGDEITPSPDPLNILLSANADLLEAVERLQTAILHLLNEPGGAGASPAPTVTNLKQKG